MYKTYSENLLYHALQIVNKHGCVNEQVWDLMKKYVLHMHGACENHPRFELWVNATIHNEMAGQAATHGNVKTLKMLLDSPFVDFNGWPREAVYDALRAGHKDVVFTFLNNPRMDRNLVENVMKEMNSAL